MALETKHEEGREGYWQYACVKCKENWPCRQSLMDRIDATQEQCAAPAHGQQRDNWSRDQVRSLRRKVKNLRAELKTQNTSIREKKERAEKLYLDLRSEHSKKCHHLARAQRGWERQMNRVIAENEWWHETVKNWIAVIEYNHPRMQDRGGYYISDVLFLLKWALAHPMYPPAVTPEPLSELVRLRRAIRATGGLGQLAQCPTCLAERTNGEHHAGDCALFEMTQEKTDGS